MLSRADNTLLTGVARDTEMGELLRRYWCPALLSSELPARDGRPLRVRLLGEDLVAFRATDGSVGIVGEFCQHRGASLYYGRNEDCGLRCVYHGWKYDSGGRCVDMPNEPPNSRFKDHIRLRAAKVVERNGIIWLYLGEGDPGFGPPELEWAVLPGEQVSITKRLTRANWAQVFEGGIDSSHGRFLHSGTIVQGNGQASRDPFPIYEAVDTVYGSMIAARHSVPGSDDWLWRVYQFLLPFYTIVPSSGDSPFIGHAFVPRDDVSTMVWSVSWHPERALVERDFRPGSVHSTLHVEKFREPTDEADSRWVPQGGRDNDYLADWQAQDTERYSGIPGVALQDAAMQESMGPIFNREQEHLGAADAGILHARRRWMALAKTLREANGNCEVPGVGCPGQYRVHSCSLMLAPGRGWLDDAVRAVQGGSAMAKA